MCPKYKKMTNFTTFGINNNNKKVNKWNNTDRCWRWFWMWYKNWPTTRQDRKRFWRRQEFYLRKAGRKRYSISISKIYQKRLISKNLNSHPKLPIFHAHFWQFLFYWTVSDMPLNHYANGPLSATGVVESVQLDEMEIDQPKSQSNELTVNMENIQLNNEKIDTSHFALLKVLGQGERKT